MPVRSETTFDLSLMLVASTAACYGFLCFAAHKYLSRRNESRRVACAIAGALSALPPFVLAAGAAAVRGAANSGTLSLTLLVAFVAGSLVGFLYHRRAGYEIAGDDVDALAQATASIDPQALIRTATAAYFDGPLQVRTSPGALALAALLGSAVLVFTAFALMMHDGIPGGLLPTMASPGMGLPAGIAGVAILIAIGTYIAHLVVRALGKTSLGAYALSGLAGPIIFMFTFGVAGLGSASLIMFSHFIVPSVVAMTAYLRMAGLEPKNVHEDIELVTRGRWLEQIIHADGSVVS